MSRFLLINFKDFGLNQDITQTIQSQTLLCICCLEKNAPLINLATCKHSDFLDNLPMPELETSRKVVCSQCHSILKQISAFRMQVEESFQTLTLETLNTAETENVRRVNLEKKLAVNIYLPPMKYQRGLDNDILPVYDKQALAERPQEPDNRGKDKEARSTRKKTDGYQKIDVVNLDSQIRYNFIQFKADLCSDQVNTGNKTNEGDDLLKDEFDGEAVAAVPPCIKIKEEPLEVKIENPTPWEPDPLEIKSEETVTSKKNKVTMIKLNRDQLMQERVQLMQSDQYLKHPHRCEHCIVGFDYRENLEDHMKRRHTPKIGSVTCDICLSVLYPPGSLNVHLFRHYTRYDCVECGKRFQCIDDAMHHYDKTHTASDHLFSCGFCTFSTDYRHKLKYHRAKHTKRFSCEYCGLVLSTHSSLRKHMTAKHKRTPFKCMVCRREFGDEDSFGAHVAEHAQPERGAHPYCAPCKLPFSTWHNYNTHVMFGTAHAAHAAHHDRFKCDACGMGFPLAHHLRMHVAFQHADAHQNKDPKDPRHADAHQNKDPKDPRMCPTAKKVKKQQLKGTKYNFQCDYCMSCYVNRRFFIMHIESHMKK